MINRSQRLETLNESGAMKRFAYCFVLALFTLGSTLATPSQAGFAVTGQEWTGNGYGYSDYAWHYPNASSSPDVTYTQNQNYAFYGIAQDSSGNIYVTTNSGEHDLLKFTSSSVTLTNPTVLASGFGYAGAVVLGADGYLYTVTGSYIYKYSTTSANQSGTEVASTGGGYINFVGLAFDGNGKLYASESNGSIVTVNKLDGSSTSTSSFSSGVKLDNKIGGVTFLNGNLYVADGNQIVEVTSSSQTNVIASPRTGVSYLGLAAKPGDSTHLYAVVNSGSGVIDQIDVSNGVVSTYLASASGSNSTGDPVSGKFMVFDSLPPLTAVPEPRSLILFGIGACCLMGGVFRHRKGWFANRATCAVV